MRVKFYGELDLHSAQPAGAHPITVKGYKSKKTGSRPQSPGLRIVQTAVVGDGAVSRCVNMYDISCTRAVIVARDSAKGI